MERAPRGLSPPDGNDPLAASSVRLAAPRPRIPDVVIEEVLGHGASSVVYAARHRERAIAVKVALDPVASERWFRREAGALARVRHEGLPAVLGVGESEGRPYILLELVRGETLEARLERGPLPLLEATALAQHLAETLDAIHRRGLAHGDVNSRNVVLARDGRPRLIDFGFAAFSPIAPGVSSAGRTGARADLAALGGLLVRSVLGIPVTPSPRHDVVTEIASRSRALATVVEGLLALDPAARYASAAEVAADLDRVRAGRPPTGPAPHAILPEAIPLVGRDAELARLAALLRHAAEGWGATALVRGARGSGKSRLGRELARLARLDGGAHLTVRCVLGDPRPLAGLDAILAAAAGLLDQRGAWAEVAERLGRDLARLASAMSEPMQRGLAVDAASLDVGKGAFAEAGSEVLLRVLDVLGPVLLTIDDAQWLDPTSAQVITHLAQRVPGARALLLVLARGNGGPGAAALMRAPTPSLERVDLAGLDASACARVVEEYLGAAAGEEITTTAARLARGSPLGLIEVLDAMIEGAALVPTSGGWVFDRERAQRMRLPTGALALLRRRAGELAPGTHAALEAAAIVGRAFAIELVREVAALEAAGLDAAVAEGLHAGLLQRTGDGALRFVHDCVREALLQGIDAPRRASLHQRVAEALARAGDADPHVLAAHFVRGEPVDPARVERAAATAIARSLERFDDLQALRLFEETEAALGRAGAPVGVALVRLAAEAELHLGRHEESAARFEEALGASRDPVDRAWLLGRIAWAHQMRPDPEAAWAALERAFTELGEGMARETPASALATALAVAHVPRPRRAPRHSRRALEVLCDLHYQNGRLGMEYGKPLRLVQSAVRAHAVAEELGPGPALAKTTALLGAVTTLIGRRRAGFARLAEAQVIARAYASPPIEAYCRQLECMGALYAGDFEGALRRMRSLIEEQGRWLEIHELCGVAANGYLLESLRGRPQEAWGWLAYAVDRTSRLDAAPPVFAVIAHGARATFAALGEAEDERIAQALRVPFDFDAPMSGFVETCTWGSRARYELELGELGPRFERLVDDFTARGVDPKTAHPMLAEYYIVVAHARLEQRLRGRGSRAALDRAIDDVAAIARYPLFQAHLAYLRGARAWIEGAPRAARRSLAEAERLADRESCPWVRVGVERIRARMLRADGHDEAADRRARGAAVIARDVGALPQARLALRENRIDAAEGRAASASQTGASLSPRHQLRSLLSILRRQGGRQEADQQASESLGEVLEAVRADRGLVLFDVSEGTNARTSIVARHAGGLPWASPGSAARKLTQEARERAVVRSDASTALERGPSRGVAVPLMLRERVIGALYVERDEGKARFTEDDLDVLVALSQQVSVALQLAQALAERDRLELHLRHAQKMEAVGRLAGGIAHDFNNMLTAMRAALDLARSDGRAAAVDTELRIVAEAIDRARRTTAQLLGFSRREDGEPEVFELGPALTELAPMLRRLLGDDIAIELSDERAERACVELDRALFEQAIVNLALNARDAMPRGGALRITTDVVDGFARVCVADTGEGMSAEVQASAFEPFFTTKGPGVGTGLGLPMAYAFVERSGGRIELESQLGRGTEIRLMFPRSTRRPDPRSMWIGAPSEEAAALVQRAPETILVVDDEALIRNVVERALRHAGYRVLAVATADDALERARQLGEELDLLVTDVLMPDMNGPELAAQLTTLCGSARVLFMSGYTGGDLIDRLDAAVPLLSKPFGVRELREAVRRVLDEALEERP